MKGAVVINGYLDGISFKEPADMLIAAGARQDIPIDVFTNSDLIAPIEDTDSLSEKLGEQDFILFWDKDVRLAKNLEVCGYSVINCSEAIRICDDKSLTHLILADYGIPSIRTIASPMTFGRPYEDAAEGIAEKIGFPMVVKDCFGSFGEQVRLLNDMDGLLKEMKGGTPKIFQEFIDCGGGLGVDYDGTRSSNSESSVNYSIQEYVNDCVYNLVEAANKNGIPHPNIITEGGRSLTAHHSVLIVDVMESVCAPQMPEDFQPGETDHKLVHDLTEIWDKLSNRSLLEDWHDAEDIREEALDLFRHGIIDLKTRAQIESIYWAISHEVAELAHHQKHVPDELRALDKQMADKYFCNFSLFQSLPDSWAIDQVFPVVPLGRLNERPDRFATIQDITCDSDGKIGNFISNQGFSHYLPVHQLKDDEHYYLGVFLVGAYQEILGDLHNLFGDTNAVHIDVYKDHYEIDQVIDGETVAEVLDYVQFSPKELVRNVEAWVADSIRTKKITAEEGNEFVRNYRSGLYGYTYLEKE